MKTLATSWRRLTMTLVFGSISWAVPRAAHGQGATDKAAAEVLFREAGELMEAAELEAACAKYQASHELDPALGTLLRLADCYDRTDKTASAWALFVEAEALALRTEQTDRAEIARTRAADLKERLSTLELEVPEAHRLQGLSISVNGVAIPAASWGTPLPVDPGPQRVEVSAPGHEPWSTSLELPKGPAERSLSVPRLTETPKPPASTATPAEVAPAAKPEQPAEPTSARRSIGYVLGGVGLVGLGTAGVLAYRAYSLNQQSLEQCAIDDPNACTAQGKQLRDQARSFGTAATVVSGVGGALLISGVVLVLTAPAPTRDRAALGVWFYPEPSGSSAGLRLEGVF